MSEKFELLADLGIVEVPADYHHPTSMRRLVKGGDRGFSLWNETVADSNFPHPSLTLHPRDKFYVRVWKRSSKKSTSSLECLRFLEEQGSVCTGVQGLLVVWRERREEFPRGYRYISLDREKYFLSDEYDHPRAPFLFVRHDGEFELDLGYFNQDWRDGWAFLSFNQIPVQARVETQTPDLDFFSCYAQ